MRFIFCNYINKKFATEFDNDEFLQHDVAKLPCANITKLLLELGNGFAFVGRQH